MMRQRTQCGSRDLRPARQLNLFADPASPAKELPTPGWQGLPEETRWLLTGLMSRLLLDHHRLEHRRPRTEATDDV
jgi:hypothetical protein